MKKNNSIKKIILLIIIIILLVLLFLFVFLKKKEPESSISYGVDPEVLTEEAPEGYHYNEDGDLVSDVPIVYPEDSVWIEESYTGGSMPPTYEDENGNKYTRKVFPSLQYSMYMPDNWYIEEQDSDFLENTYYLKPNDLSQNSERLQICISSISGLEGLSLMQKKEQFEPVVTNYEYNLYGYRFVSTWFESTAFESVDFSQIPGFEDIDQTVEIYKDYPKMVFQLKNNAGNIIHPYVEMYYVFKDDIAVLITVLGGNSDGIDMSYLGGTIAYNIRKVKDASVNSLHYDNLVDIEKTYISLKIPSSWESEVTPILTEYYTPTLDRTQEGYGIQIFVEDHLKAQNVDNFNLNKMGDFIELVMLSSLGNCNQTPYKEVTAIDRYVSYSPKLITKVNIGGNTFLRVPFKLCIDNFSYSPDFGLTEPKKNNVAYFLFNDDGTYTVIDFQFLEGNENYMNTLIQNVLQTVTINQ